MLSLIVARSENRVIGRNNALLWHLPDDLKHFKRTTRGHHVIMGRKTFESQGRPLPHRTNVVITRDPAYQAKGCKVVHSLEEALQLARDDDEPFVIGGEQIYRMALPRVERIYLTLVHTELEGDTFFPEIDKNQWQEVERRYHPPDQEHRYDFTVLVFDRRRS